MHLKTFAILATSTFFVTQNAHAANWQPVESFQGERVEIDKSRIARIGEGKTVAWSRLVLGRNMQVNDSNDSYSTVEALNRYDCDNRRFTTVRRVYLQGSKIIKQESVGSPREMSIVSGSVDEKLLTEACKLRTVTEMKKVAEAVSKAASAAGMNVDVSVEPPPKAMYADMRLSGESKPAQLRSVSDTQPAKTEAQPAKAEAPAKIELPSKTELAAKAAAEKAVLAPPPAPTAPTAAAPAAPAPQASPPVIQRKSYSSMRAAARSQRKKPSPEETAAHASETPHALWGYEGEGAPTNWSKLRSDFATCATGKRQSPIDIRESIHVDLEPIKFDYKLSQVRIIDNGHTVQVNVGEGNGIDIMGRHYELTQLQFHRPAEERINGKTYDMVVHLVHKDSDGRLAVVAVLLEKGNENPLIQTIWNNLPLEVGLEVTPSVPIDLNRLLPEIRNYWTYMGSLTTPPCTEDVLWMILKQPQQISPEQVAIFSRLYRNNARPVQPANNRLVKESR